MCLCQQIMGCQAPVRVAQQFSFVRSIWSQEVFAEPAQFCEMVVTGALEEAADPARRAARFPALQPRRLAAALHRYRELDANTFSLSRNPRMPKVSYPPAIHAITCSCLAVVLFAHMYQFHLYICGRHRCGGVDG